MHWRYIWGPVREGKKNAVTSTILQVEECSRINVRCGGIAYKGERPSMGGEQAGH